MTDQALTDAVREHLRAHLASHPAAGAEDIVKYIFQALLGVGHLLGSPEQVESYLTGEMSALQPDPEEPLTEPVGPDWCRLNLRRAMAEGLAPRDIARLMLSAPSPAHTRQEVADVCLAIAGAEKLPDLRGVLACLEDPAWLPSHSEAYRAAYRPAYRVIGADWMSLTEAVCRIARLKREKKRVTVTLDGPCASGKTTIAQKLAEICDAAVLHTDDFVIPHAQKTPGRLAVPGGNCDSERIAAEVLAPWAAGKTPVFRRYDCHADCLLPPETLPDRPVLLLEGSYCNLPALRAYADLRLFADTPEDVRTERLLRRESPASMEMFRTRWIPLENAYFTAFGLPDADCIRVR
ncbi:MAG: hypothetical protein IKS31_04110 [Clostridia bacterium]|nr:hypothetical protein [Clostridia bacterium]